jgi:hypothetical protein
MISLSSLNQPQKLRIPLESFSVAMGSSFIIQQNSFSVHDNLGISILATLVASNFAWIVALDCANSSSNAGDIVKQSHPANSPHRYYGTMHPSQSYCIHVSYNNCIFW